MTIFKYIYAGFGSVWVCFARDSYKGGYVEDIAPVSHFRTHKKLLLRFPLSPSTIAVRRVTRNSRITVQKQIISYVPTRDLRMARFPIGCSKHNFSSRILNTIIVRYSSERSKTKNWKKKNVTFLKLAFGLVRRSEIPRKLRPRSFPKTDKYACG